MIPKIETAEREKYSNRELESLAESVYDETVNVLGMEMDALRIIKEFDEPYYSQLLEGIQEYIDVYICPFCKKEYEDEDDARECRGASTNLIHQHESITDLEDSEENEE